MRSRAGPWAWLAAAAVLPGRCSAAGGAKLWELGQDVEQNPITVFVMFGFTVLLTVIVEMIKHTVEHNTTDPYRLLSLGVIYSELMMIGVISFLLIMVAELGLNDMRITWFCDDDAGSAAGSATGSATGSGNSTMAPTTGGGSGSGSQCGLGFDMLLFEYAHLVLFGMGLSYCVFIQISFRTRDRHVKTISDLQAKTIMSWFQEKPQPASTLSIMGWDVNNKGWARAVLSLRSGIVLLNERRIRNCCQPQETVHEQWLAAFRGDPIPSATPPPDQALVNFDMARFCHISVSEALLDLLHVPAVVWGGIVIMAAANLIHKTGIDLADAVLMISGFGPCLSIFLLWRMAVQLKQVVERAAGHPRLAEFDLYTANGPRPQPGEANPLNLTDAMMVDGQGWYQASKEYEARRSVKTCENLEAAQPWAILTGMCDDDSPWGRFDPLDPGALELQIQLVVFCTCFYFGQVIMLTTLINDHIGPLWTVVCWLIPMPPVLMWMPRCILIFALTHKTRETPRSWLRHALKLKDDEAAAKEHGHEHGHGGGGGGCCGCCGGGHHDDHGTVKKPKGTGDHQHADAISRATEFGMQSDFSGPAKAQIFDAGSDPDDPSDPRSRTLPDFNDTSPLVKGASAARSWNDMRQSSVSAASAGTNSGRGRARAIPRRPGHGNGSLAGRQETLESTGVYDPYSGLSSPYSGVPLSQHRFGGSQTPRSARSSPSYRAVSEQLRPGRGYDPAVMPLGGGFED